MIGRVYAIRSHQTTDFYIGSTISKLNVRMSGHNKDYKIKKNYITSFEILKYEDAYIELIEEGEFETIELLRLREGHFIREMNCVNKNIAGRTHEKYRFENKEIIAEKNKQYRFKNKEIIAEKDRQYSLKNKDLISKKGEQYYIKNKEALCAKTKQYYLDNKEIIAKRQQQYHAKKKATLIHI